jgi:hypothetical protein
MSQAAVFNTSRHSPRVPGTARQPPTRPLQEPLSSPPGLHRRRVTKPPLYPWNRRLVLERHPSRRYASPELRISCRTKVPTCRHAVLVLPMPKHFECHFHYIAEVAWAWFRELTARPSSLPSMEQSARNTLSTVALSKCRIRKARWFSDPIALVVVISGPDLLIEGQDRHELGPPGTALPADERSAHTKGISPG